jgi:putative membrane protein
MQLHHGTVIGMVLASFVVVHTQQPAPASKEPSSQRAGTLTAADREFITQAAADGHKEIALAQLAEQKGTSPSVKALAQRIRKDHMQAEQELKSLAQSKTVALPTPGEHKAEIAKFEKDANFDQTYASMMVADHKKAIALFERASNSKDADVKAFADKTLPALREHLKLAEDAVSMKTSNVDKPSGASPAGTSGNPGTSKPGTAKPGDQSAKPGDQSSPAPR